MRLMGKEALRRRLRQRFDFTALVSRGLSCRRLSREEVARIYPGVAISPRYGLDQEPHESLLGRPAPVKAPTAPKRCRNPTTGRFESRTLQFPVW